MAVAQHGRKLRFGDHFLPLILPRKSVSIRRSVWAWMVLGEDALLNAL